MCLDVLGMHGEVEEVWSGSSACWFDRCCFVLFGLWRVCFPPCLVRPGRRLPVQGLSEGSLGFRDRLPA